MIPKYIVEWQMSTGEMDFCEQETLEEAISVLKNIRSVWKALIIVQDNCLGGL
jgi:hypothetical protein